MSFFIPNHDSVPPVFPIRCVQQLSRPCMLCFCSSFPQWHEHDNTCAAGQHLNGPLWGVEVRMLLRPAKKHNAIRRNSTLTS